MGAVQLTMSEACKKRFAPAAEAIEELISHPGHQVILVGIDGMCATGKTTLAYYLRERFECNLFHMDDFFLQEFQRTPKRLSETGGNVDYERFKAEVLEPVLSGGPVRYRRYNCHTGKLSDIETIPRKRLNIIEGSYSLHPYFGDVYALRIFTESAPEVQLLNIRERNGEELLKRFAQEWIPKENDYFEKFRIREGCIPVPWMGKN